MKSDVAEPLEFQPHPCTELFPPMDEEPLDALVADMKANGQREPIVVDQHNRIVDGLNRYRACIRLNIAPKIERRTFSDIEALKFCLSRNLHRRHLTPSQRAAIAAEIATRKQGGDQAANLPDAISQAEAAKIMQTSERAVRSAAKVKRHSPELHQQVMANAIPLHVAEQKVVEELEKAGGGKPKKSNKAPRLVAPDGDDVAASPGVYAALFAELYALPHYLSDHPLLAQQAGELTALLTEAIKQIERASKPETTQTGST
jgi:ParB-like chromosome segregation protein Spo0J